MRYEMMFPDQIRRAMDEHWPAIVSVGVFEYHAEHCVVGVDTLVVQKAVESLEKEIDMVIFPVFWYGSASYAVEPPERNGTLQFTSRSTYPWAKEFFRGILRVGFRNIHLFIHHQSENFLAGMPTDLALRLAAREVIFEWIEKERGEGWWGKEEMKDYYTEHEAGTDPFNWIKVHPFMDEETQKIFPVDHAGIQETSLMLAFCPDGVDMKRFSGKKWYCRKAPEATLEYGRKARDRILARMRRILKGEQAF